MTAISAASATESDSPETANPFPDLAAINGPDASPQLPHPRGPAPRSYPRPRFGDYSRTRFESRVAFGGPDEDEDAEDEFIAASTRKFSVWEIMSGLPDDSREEDERAAERRLRDLRGRVKAARALVSATPGLADTLRGDWQKAVRFYARFGITEDWFRRGIPFSGLDEEVSRPSDFPEVAGNGWADAQRRTERQSLEALSSIDTYRGIDVHPTANPYRSGCARTTDLPPITRHHFGGGVMTTRPARHLQDKGGG